MVMKPNRAVKKNKTKQKHHSHPSSEYGNLPHHC